MSTWQKMDEELDSHEELVSRPNTKCMIWTYFGCLKVNGIIKDPDNPSLLGEASQ